MAVPRTAAATGGGGGAQPGPWATRIVRESADPCSDGLRSGNGKLNWQGALAPSELSRLQRILSVGACHTDLLCGMYFGHANIYCMRPERT